MSFLKSFKMIFVRFASCEQIHLEKNRFKYIPKLRATTIIQMIFTSLILEVKTITTLTLISWQSWHLGIPNLQRCFTWFSLSLLFMIISHPSFSHLTGEKSHWSTCLWRFSNGNTSEHPRSWWSHLIFKLPKEFFKILPGRFRVSGVRESRQTGHVWEFSWRWRVIWSRQKRCSPFWQTLGSFGTSRQMEQMRSSLTSPTKRLTA